VATAIERGVPVTTIAFGTDDGTIVLPDDPVPIPVPVDRAALEAIAAETGGSYFSAVTAEQLEAIYVDIGSSIGFTTEDRPVTAWFVGAALVALGATAAMSLAWFSRLP
jgi:Ca-activated chloride channel family protein